MIRIPFRARHASAFRASLLAGTALIGVQAGLVASSAFAAEPIAGSATIVSSAAAGPLVLTQANESLPQAGYFGNQAYLNGAGGVTNGLGVTATLSEGGGTPGTVYSGVVADGTAAATGLIHTGGQVLLTGANTFSGGFAITGGTVIAGASQTLGATSNTLTVSGGSFGTGATTQQLQALTVSGTGLVSVNKGGTLTAGSIGLTSATSQVLVAAGGTVNDDVTNAGSIGNAGVWNGTVALNAGAIGNAGLWKGGVTANRGAIGNLGVWVGTVGQNSGAIGNVGTWTGNITNTTTGVLVTGKGSTVNGTVVNNGQVFAYGGTFNGDIQNYGSVTLPGPGSVDTSAYGPLVAAATNGKLTGDGIVTSNGNFINESTGVLTITPQAVYTVHGGDIVNYGQFDNAGTVYDDFYNYSNAVGESGSIYNSNFINRGIFTSKGTTINGDFYNSGSLISNTTTISGNLINFGKIDLSQNKSTGNSLQATLYTGMPGSTAIVNVDLSSNTVGKASQLTFNKISGTSGSTLITFVNVGTDIGAHGKVAIVNGDDSNAVFVADQNSVTSLRNGPLQYKFYNSNMGDYLQPAVNGSTTAEPVTQVAAVVTSLNTDFFQDWQPFITAPQDPDPNSVSGGPWVRGKYGHETSDQTAFVNGASPTPSRVATEFSGFQVGSDIGLFNINKTGWNVIGGITGGEVFATETEKLAGNIKGGFTIPFVGVYGALTNGPFHADIMYRHDFYSLKLNDAADGLVNKGLAANGDSVSMDAGYSFALGTLGAAMGNFFLEPNASLIISDVGINPLVFGANVGTLKSNDVDSLLSRVGLRFGTSMVVDKLALQPFMTAAVWHEFDGNATSVFSPSGGDATPFNLAVTREGTFGQFGLGLNGELLGSNILGTIRADFRVGEKVDGQSVTAQLRYQF